MAVNYQNKFISLNTQGLKSNFVYINSLLCKYQVIFICEHWLLNAEKYLLEDAANPTHDIFFSPAEKGISGRPFGGNCLLVKHCTSNHQIIHEDKHIFALRTILDGNPVLIIGVYLTSYHDKQSLTEYNDQLSIISSLLKSNAGEYEPIIIGDFQSFPSDIYDLYQRTSLKRNPLSTPLKNFLISNNLKLCDVTDGEGPSVTYRHPLLPNCSYIDHIAVSSETSLLIEDCHVLPPESSNCSDHTPVSFTINCQMKPSLEGIIEENVPRTLRKWVWKDPTFVEMYQSLLEEKLGDVSIPDSYEDQHVIDMLDILVETAFTAAESVFPISKKKYSKSWWNAELSEAKAELSLHFNNWRDDGFPKDGGVIHCRYLLARKMFRKRVKKAQNDEIRKKYLLFDKLKNTEPRKFWNRMKALRKTESKRLYTINDKQTGPEIANEFADHFSTLLNYPRVPVEIEHYDIDTDEDENITFSSIDIGKAIASLKMGKSLDPFNVGSEHIIYAGNLNLSNWLAGLYNDIPKKCDTPPSLSESKMVPIVKSLKKSLKTAGNYRGISIIPILTKILEYLILHKCPELTDTHPLQFGFTQDASTLHAEFTINETIKAYNKKGSCIYMCSLDAEKAFDSCNWDALFKKLVEEKKIPPKIVKIISALYRNGTAQIHYENCISDTFKLSQGVRQGSILSPYLYNIYTELLLNSLQENCKVGTSIHGLFTGVIMYADDIILLSPTVSGLQKMVDECTEYCNNLGVAINAEKTEFLASGVPANPGCYLTMDYTRIHPGKSLKHLGFLWNVNHKTYLTAGIEHENIDQRISKFWSVVYGLLQAGICSCAPHTRVALFRSIAIPTLTYGLELCNLGSTIGTKLDCEGRRALKSFFNVSRYSKNYLQKLFYLNKITTTIKNNKTNLCYRLSRNTTTKPLLLHILNEGHNNSFIGGLLEDGVNILDVLMHGHTRIKDDFQLPNGIREDLEMCIEKWDLPEARYHFWQLLEEKIPGDND